MADKSYKLTFKLSDGSEQSVEFTAPQGEKGDPGVGLEKMEVDADGNLYAYYTESE